MPLPRIQNSSRANNQLSRNQSIVERNIELDSLEELVQKEYMSIRDIIQMSRSELRDEQTQNKSNQDRYQKAYAKIAVYQKTNQQKRPKSISNRLGIQKGEYKSLANDDYQTLNLIQKSKLINSSNRGNNMNITLDYEYHSGT